MRLSAETKIQHVKEHLEELLADSKKGSTGHDYQQGYELGVKKSLAILKVWFREELNHELNQEAA